MSQNDMMPVTGMLAAHSFAIAPLHVCGHIDDQES